MGRINTKVTINGTGFTEVSSVKFKDRVASFNVLSPTQLTANVPSGTTTGKITVRTPAGTASSATDFVVVFPPTVTGFTPGSGVPGTTVVITGTNFDTATAVAFNGFGRDVHHQLPHSDHRDGAVHGDDRQDQGHQCC